jgi:DNA-binding transcriptional ArsR family regulator
MDKEYFSKLTSRLYRLTLFFPQADPIKSKMRKLGTDILSNLIFILEGAFYKSKDIIDDTKRDVETLDSFFEVVKDFNWVKDSELLEIKKEYSKIGKELKRISEIQSIEAEEVAPLQIEGEKEDHSDEVEEEEEGIELSELELKKEKPRKKKKEKVSQKKEDISSDELLDRQKKILNILKEKDKAQVGDFKEIFPDVSKRTLRRDFKYLTEQGFLERKGERNNTFYKVKG